MHSPTLLVVTALLVGMMALVLWVSSLINGRTPGLRLWTQGFGFGTLFCVSLLARPVLPDALSVVLTQTSLFLMAYWLLRATHAYVGVRPPAVWPAVLGIPALVGAAMVLSHSATGGHHVRFLIVSWPTAWMFFLAARRMVGGGWKAYPARHLYATVCGLHALFMLLRPFAFGLGDKALFDGNYALQLSQVVMLESLLAVLLTGFVVLMLANEHVNNQLRMLAEQDPLTNAFNRRAYLTLLEKACSLAHRTHTPLPVLVIDLDHFKQINDTWGHQVGDEVLRHFVAVVAQVLRKEDVLGRLGGEEFSIFLPNSTAHQAATAAERLRQLVAEQRVTAAEGEAVAFSISVGVAVCNPGESAQTALQRADEAMYRAKRQGRNQVQVAADQGSTRVS